jgi:hypothetical protein
MPHELMEKEGAKVAALSRPNREHLISARTLESVPTLIG